MGQGISLYLKIEAKNKHTIKPPTYLLMFTNNPSSGCLHDPLPTLTNVDTRSFLPMSRNACFKNHKSISSGPHLMIAFLSRRSKKSRMFSFSFRLFLLTRSFARKVRIRKSSQFILSQTSSNSWRQLHIVPSISIFNVYKTCAPRAYFNGLCNTQNTYSGSKKIVGKIITEHLDCLCNIYLYVWQLH